MKRLPLAAGILLGLLFIMAGGVVLLGMAPKPEMPEGSPPDLFMDAFVPTGYLTFVKVLEVVGGIFVMAPKTRSIGLLILGPIIINILAFHIFITGGQGLFSPMLIVICLLAAYLLWVERKAFAALTGCCQPK